MLKLIFVLAAVTVATSPALANESLSNEDVECAARQFRIATYDSLRLNRELFNSRQEAGNQLWQNWTDAGQPDEFRSAVIQWFEAAAAAGPEESLPPLPELPGLPIAGEVNEEVRVDELVIELPTELKDAALSDPANAGDGTIPTSTTLEPATESESAKPDAQPSAGDDKATATDKDATEEPTHGVSKMINSLGRAMSRAVGAK